MDEKEYSEQRLEDQIAWYDKRSGTSQRLYKRLRLAEVICAASIPFWIGLIELLEGVRYWLALLGVVVAVITGAQGVWKFQENWMAYRATCEMLRHEKYFYETGCGPYKDAKDRLCLLVNRVEELISQENTNWRKYMNQEKNQGQAAS
jgi:hypothetical protein